MNIEVIAFTEKGYRLSEWLREQWLFSPGRRDGENPPSSPVDSSPTGKWTMLETENAEAEPIEITHHAKTAALPQCSDPRSLHDIVAAWFEPRSCDAVIFVGATGIAVRAISPFLTRKDVDPAVLVIDEAGHYVISLLSGHLGGANALARTVAALIGAEPIITTATDEEGAFSVDLFAKENGFLLTDLKKAKEVTAKLLRGEKLRIYSDLPLERLSKRPTQQEMVLISAAELATADVILSYRTKWLEQPIGLRLIAKKVYVGLGARKGVPQEEVAKAVSTCLADAGIDLRAVAALVSIDLKKQEAGILAYSYETGIPFVTYTAEELRSVDGSFAASSFVQSVTGVANVCERAAAFAAGRNGHAEVLVHKTIHGNVTTAIAVEV